MQVAIIATLIMLLGIGADAVAQTNVCYPGLDCPEDIPRPGENPPPPAPKPPAPQPAPYDPPQPQPAPVVHNCADPWGALMATLIGGAQPPPCHLPATHCCLQDGSFVPLDQPGSIGFAASCSVYMNMGGIPIPMQEGLGCRR